MAAHTLKRFLLPRKMIRVPGFRQRYICNACGVGHRSYNACACSVCAKRDPATRFWSFVNKDGPVPAHSALGPCWVWTGCTKKGWPYGRFSVQREDGKHYLLIASRFAYELHHGTDPGEMFVCHHCDNPQCVRPDHLFLGTALDNNHDSMRKNRSRASRGESQWLAKLTDEKVREILATHIPGVTTASDFTAKYGVTRNAIQRVLNGQGWKHVERPSSC